MKLYCISCCGTTPPFPGQCQSYVELTDEQYEKYQMYGVGQLDKNDFTRNEWTLLSINHCPRCFSNFGGI